MSDNTIDILRFIDKDGNSYTANMDRLVFVHLNGDENIKGRKTFDTPPLIPSYNEGDPDTEAINAATLKAYINNLDNKAVSTLDRNQEIQGIKTFKNLKAEITELQNSVVIKNTSSSPQDLTSTINFTDNTGLTSSSNLISQIKSTSSPSDSKLTLKTSSNGKTGTLSVEVDNKGRAFATAPTVTDINDNSDKVVTTEFLRKYTLNLIYPVGAVFISTISTNPGTYLGGTWERIQGKFLLGADNSHPADTTGGEETHTLTTDEMPVHKHDTWVSSNGEHYHNISMTPAGEHTHTRGTMEITGSGFNSDNEWADGLSGAFAEIGYTNRGCQNDSTGRTWNFVASRTWTGATSSSGNHTHSTSISKSGFHSHEVLVQSTGKNQAHNNMPPYISVYMFKRTA